MGDFLCRRRKLPEDDGDNFVVRIFACRLAMHPEAVRAKRGFAIRCALAESRELGGSGGPVADGMLRIANPRSGVAA